MSSLYYRVPCNHIHVSACKAPEFLFEIVKLSSAPNPGTLPREVVDN